MATMELPNLKTLVEKTDKGTLNVWFKYANVSAKRFVNIARKSMSLCSCSIDITSFRS